MILYLFSSLLDTAAIKHPNCLEEAVIVCSFVEVSHLIVWFSLADYYKGFTSAVIVDSFGNDAQHYADEKIKLVLVFPLLIVSFAIIDIFDIVDSLRFIYLKDTRKALACQTDYTQVPVPHTAYYFSIVVYFEVA